MEHFLLGLLIIQVHIGIQDLFDGGRVSPCYRGNADADLVPPLASRPWRRLIDYSKEAASRSHIACSLVISSSKAQEALFIGSERLGKGQRMKACYRKYSLPQVNGKCVFLRSIYL